MPHLLSNLFFDMKKYSRKIVGRKLGNMHYIHRSAISYLNDDQKKTLKKAIDITTLDDWNLVKIAKDLTTVSLLNYENFDSVLFPCLLEATIVNLKNSSFKYIDYQSRKNPPVLHRKELMLAPDDPRVPVFAKTTTFCEDRNLFDRASYIGTKLKWEERLLQHGYIIKDQTILPI